MIKQVLLSQINELLDKVYALHSMATICIHVKSKEVSLSTALHESGNLPGAQGWSYLLVY